MAKCADESIEEPRRWVRQFDAFPLDEVGPDIFEMIAGSVVSTKNLQRLQSAMKSLKPKKQKSTSTKSPSRQSKEG